MSTVTADAIETRITAALEEFGADPDAINREATFEALDVDSLDMVELAQIIEDEYGVVLKEDDLKELTTVGSAIDLIVERASA